MRLRVQGLELCGAAVRWRHCCFCFHGQRIRWPSAASVFPVSASRAATVQGHHCCFLLSSWSSLLLLLPPPLQPLSLCVCLCAGVCGCVLLSSSSTPHPPLLRSSFASIPHEGTWQREGQSSIATSQVSSHSHLPTPLRHTHTPHSFSSDCFSSLSLPCPHPYLLSLMFHFSLPCLLFDIYNLKGLSPLLLLVQLSFSVLFPGITSFPCWCAANLISVGNLKLLALRVAVSEWTGACVRLLPGQLQRLALLSEWPTQIEVTFSLPWHTIGPLVVN